MNGMRYAHHASSQAILKIISDRKLLPGMKLPPIRQLSKMIRSSIQTVQGAIHELNKEGVLESKGGSGVYVKSLQPHLGPGKRIGVLTPGSAEYLKNAYPKAVLDPLEKLLGDAGWETVFVPSNRWAANMDALREEDFAAYILFEIDSPFLVTELKRMRRLMISADADLYTLGLSSVSYDHEFGMMEATEHLIQHGHTNITFVRWLITRSMGGFEYPDPIDDRRLLGYRLAMQRAGLQPRVLESSRGSSNLRARVREHMSTPKAPTAFVCHAQFTAEKVAMNIQEMGYRIPDDVSLVSFGNEVKEFAPGQRVTAVEADYEGMGTASAKLLLREIEGSNQVARVLVPARLARGDSTAPPNKNIRMPVLEPALSEGERK